MVKYYKTNQTNPNRQRKTVPSNRAVIRKRYSNAGVRKALAAKPTKPKPAAKTNKNAIMVLSKQVRSLQLQRYGFKQFQHQHMLNAAFPNSSYMAPDIHHPYAFLVNDFFNASKVFRGTITSGSPVLEEVLQFSKVISDLDIDTQYLWNNKQQHDQVSSQQYLPITSTMKFRVEYVTDVDFVRPIRVRIQVFKFKNQTVNGKFTMSLPYNLGAYWHMCDRNPTNRNHLNTAEYHDVVVDKSVYLKPSFLYSGVTSNDRYLNCKIYFPPKEVKLDLTSDPLGQNVYNTIPTKDQYWCLISTDAETNNRVKVYLERWNVWRDNNGVGS